MLNRLTGFALSIAATFLVVMAVLVNSPPLFYMTVAVVATLAASRLQAWLAVRGLRFERAVPPVVSIGEAVTVETVVWSERRLKRPLVSVEDTLPSSLAVRERKPSLPIAPSYDQPIKTRFSFKPMRRGRYSWRNLVVRGTDALGLVTMERTYSSNPVELTVCPVPIPVSVELRPLTGWGLADLDSGRGRGSGIETRGVREYAPGDEIRHVHWRSSARLGRLMVKEFDTGSGMSIAFILQATQGTDIGPAGGSTFEAACGHALYLAETYIERGAHLWFPEQEPEEASKRHPEQRLRDVREILTDVQATSSQTVSEALARIRANEGTTALLLLAVQDPNLPGEVSRRRPGSVVCLVYDAREYDAKTKAPRAADPVYVAALEQAGAVVQMMPKVEAIA